MTRYPRPRPRATTPKSRAPILCLGFTAALSEIWAGIEVVELTAAGVVAEPVVGLATTRVVSLWDLPALSLVPVAEEALDDTVELSTKTPPFLVVAVVAGEDEPAGDAALFFSGPAQYPLGVMLSQDPDLSPYL